MRSWSNAYVAHTAVQHGTSEGGLQGQCNFDGARCPVTQVESDGSLTTPPVHSDRCAGGVGAAIGLGNGEAWNGNTFNNRTTISQIMEE